MRLVNVDEVFCDNVWLYDSIVFMFCNSWMYKDGLRNMYKLGLWHAKISLALMRFIHFINVCIVCEFYVR